MPRMFMSYRRSDSISESGRMHDHLEREFGARNVFKDVDDIPPGLDFRKVLDDEVAQCDVLLVIIGQKWVSAADDDGNRRLHNPDDFVRIEVESGLKRGDEVLVIPVLINNAKMPSKIDLPDSLHELTYRNAVTVRNDPDFNRDMNRLIHYIRHYTKRSRPTVPPRVIIGGLVLVVALMIGALVLTNLPDDPAATTTNTATEAVDDATENPTTKVAEGDEITLLYNAASEQAGNANYPEAIDLYDELIALDESNAPAYLGRALAHASGYGDYVTAISDLEQAIELDPNYAEAYRYLGRYTYFEGDYDAVEAHLLRAIELNPADVDARLWLAEYYGDVSDYNLAEDQYDALLDAKDTLDVDTLYSIWLGKANAQAALGEVDAAADTFLSAIELDPSRYEAYAELGSLKVYANQFTDAIEYLDTAIEKIPDNADNVYNRGYAHLNLQNYTQAQSDFDRVLQLSPNYTSAYVRRGQVYTALGNTTSAISDFSQAIRRDDTDGEAYYQRGIAHYDAENYELAIDDFTTAIDMETATANAYALRGLAYVQLEDNDLARDDLESAIDDGVEGDLLYDVLTELGWLILYESDDDTALTLFAQAMALYPDRAAAYDGEADVFIEAADLAASNNDAYNNWLSALDSLSRGIDNTDDNIDLYFKRGQVNQQIGLLRDDDTHLESAINDFQQVIDLDETMTSAYVHLAELMLVLDNDDDALDFAQTAYNIDPTDAYTLGTLGSIHLAMDDTDEAIRYYELAVENSVDDDERNTYQAQLDDLLK